MATTSFKPGEEGAVITTDIPPGAKQVGAPIDEEADEAEHGDEEAPYPQAVASFRRAPGQYVTGDLKKSDNTPARLRIIQPGSDAIGVFPLGSICINDETKLSDGKTPLTMVVLSLDKTFVENLPYEKDREVRPRVLLTEAEVLAEGGTLTYTGEKNDIPPTWKPQAEMQVAIMGEDTVIYGNEVCGKNWAFLTWHVKGMAYNHGARPVLTNARSVRGDIPLLQWSLTSKSEKTRKGMVYVPVMRVTGRLTQEMHDGLLDMV